MRRGWACIPTEHGKKRHKMEIERENGSEKGHVRRRHKGASEGAPEPHHSTIWLPMDDG